MADEREIAAYYDRGEEEGRLGDWGRLDFLRTRELLSRFLPAAPATVLLEVLLRAIRRVEGEPSLLGASHHVMALASAP